MKPRTSSKVPTRGSGSISYLRAVALHISGQTTQEIAANLDCHESTVIAALNSPEGKALIHEAKRRIRENVFGHLEAKLIDLATTSVDNLEETVNAKFVPGSRGKIHQDNVGLKLLGVLGYTEGTLGDQRRKSGIQVNDELGQRLLKALDKANENAQAEDLKLGREAYITDVEDLSEVSDAVTDN